MRNGTFLLVASAVLAGSAGCGGASVQPSDGEETTIPPVTEASALTPEVSAALGVLSQHALFFDHASVGQLVMLGVERLASSTLGAHPTRLEFDQGHVNPAQVNTGIFADHYFVAENGYPLQKMAEFQNADLTTSGLGSKLDGLGGVAFMKLCFADFDSPGLTTPALVTQAFQTYQATSSQLQSSFPNVKLIHVTAALRSGGNELREQFNDLIRSTYGSTGRVFDLADIESNGHRDTSGIRVMDPGYNDGSDHPNVAGQDALATALVLCAAGVFESILTAVAVNPVSVVGGAPSIGTVTLSGAAPSGGAVVALSSDSAAAAVPASVTVAAGATSAVFTVTTTVVTTSTSATISASYGTASLTDILTVTPSPPPSSLTSVTLSPTSAVGGVSSVGTVTLSGTAPSGGAVVALSSDSAAVAVPASVTVAAGATSATFTATTSVVNSVTTTTITATYAGVSRTASLTVNPVVVASLAQDAGFPTRNVYGWTSGTKNFSFTTPGANRLVAVAICYANYLQAATAHTVSGGGLTWTLARQTLADGNSTFVSLWYAWVPAAGTYTATFNSGLTRTYDAFLTVHSFSGSSASGIGATAGASGSNSRPSLGSITTTGTPAYLLAVGYDNGAAPAADASSTITAVDTSAGPAFWTERSTSTVSPGTHAIGLTSPTAPHSWAMAAVEIKGTP